MLIYHPSKTARDQQYSDQEIQLAVTGNLDYCGLDTNAEIGMAEFRGKRNYQEDNSGFLKAN